MASRRWMIAGSVVASAMLLRCKDVVTDIQTANTGAVRAALAGPVSPTPSGERVAGQSVLEPVYDAEHSGLIGYVSTPMHAPMHADSNAWSPFYVPVYPAGSTVGTLLCKHVPIDNCPDHGPEVAGAAAAIMPAVYGAGVIGHDHLMDYPGGQDFNIAWEPVLVLFTNKAAANHHLLTDTDVDAAVARGDAIEVPAPQLTFHCAPVAAVIYAKGTPLP